MPTTPADRQRSTLAAIAFLALVLAGLSLRAIKSARQLGTVTVPLTDLQTLSSFLMPLPEPSIFDYFTASTMVVTRDPFVSTLRSRAPVAAGATVGVSQPVGAPAQRWVVSSILFEGTNRSAIVNNAWVTVGDPLGGGSRLTAIERDHVVITDAQGVRHVVQIKGGES